MTKIWNAVVELLAILLDAAEAAWAAADLVARLREWRWVVTHPDLVDGDPVPVVGAYRALNTRQERILSVAHERGRISNRVARGALPLAHPETVRLDLVGLVARGLLERQGANKGTYYTPVACRRQ